MLPASHGKSSNFGSDTISARYFGTRLTFSKRWRCFRRGVEHKAGADPDGRKRHCVSLSEGKVAGEDDEGLAA